MADKDRLEREINEILDKIEQFPTAESRRARARKRALRRAGDAIASRQRALTRQLGRISISQLILISFLIVLGSFFFRRFNPVLMQWALYAGIVLFVSSFAILLFSRPRSSSPRYWRGRRIAYRSEPITARVRRWLASKRRRR
jgi:hypothetical protein